MAVTSFSNVFVQSYINHFGTFCMGGWTAYNKIDALLFMPMQSIALASTTFVGQKLGKNQPARARKGADTALIMAAAGTVIAMIPVLIFAEKAVAFFNPNPEVVRYGSEFLRYITPFYVLCCVNQVYSGALRGAGDTKAPMIIMLLSFVAFRQVYLYIMANFIVNEHIPIAMGYPAGWLVCSTITFIYYRRADLGRTRVVED
jgi:Na+-driven multidrug efflux pump